jgi:hypothetical protein
MRSASERVPFGLKPVATLDNDSKERNTVSSNFGDFQNLFYAEAVHGVTTRYPFDFASIERKASEALPDWVYPVRFGGRG